MKLPLQYITTCDGKINNVGICEKCFQPAQTTSSFCGRQIIESQKVEVIQQEKTDFAEWASDRGWAYTKQFQYWHNMKGSIGGNKSSSDLYSDFIESKSKQLKP